MTSDLFSSDIRYWREDICAGASVLRNFATPHTEELLATLDDIIAQAPLRHMITPGGRAMSVEMTNCGPLGWVSDHNGYRYSNVDPETLSRWPPLPDIFSKLAEAAADNANFAEFSPDACLINRYQVGTRLSLHQDKDERDFSHPIVSVSLGLPATFLFGGPKRTDKTQRVMLTHGDVVVWGGPARRYYHGIAPLKAGVHPRLGEYRINLTFRRAS